MGYDAPYQREPQTASLRCVGMFALIELVKCMQAYFFGHADAGILDADDDGAFQLPAADGERSSGFGELDGIVNEIAPNLREQRFAAVILWRISSDSCINSYS